MIDATEFERFYSNLCHYDRYLGLRLSVQGPGKITYLLDVDERHLSMPPACHGGVIAGMRDATLGVTALLWAVEQGKLCATVEFFTAVEEFMSELLAWGAPGTPTVATGVALEWDDRLLDQPEPLKDAIVYAKGHMALFKAAFIVEHGAAALLMAEGGRNYHPLILATEAGLPAIAGVGGVDVAGRQVTVDSGAGKVYAAPAAISPPVPAAAPPPADAAAPEVYVNVGYPNGLATAARSGAAGLGLLRTEFAAVKALALNLNQTLDDGRRWRELLAPPDGNEADAIYAIVEDSSSSALLQAEWRATVAQAVVSFAPREVIVRTLDIPRRLDEPMGNRGIRRCVGEGGGAIRVLCAALRDVLLERGGRIGLILPLVSHYSQIRAAMQCALDSGLNLQRPGSTAPCQIRFGWEIEQPAAAQNNPLWLAAFTAEFGQPPHLIGVGTNDLTQFTIALGRDAQAEEKTAALATYLSALYDEREFSVARQILEAAAQCRAAGTRVFLLGQAGADPLLAPLLFACRITPSVAVGRVAEVQRLAQAALQPGAAAQAVQAYKAHVLGGYPKAAAQSVANALDDFLALTLPPS